MHGKNVIFESNTTNTSTYPVLRRALSTMESTKPVEKIN
jgi:hypothetical protein